LIVRWQSAFLSGNSCKQKEERKDTIRLSNAGIAIGLLFLKDGLTAIPSLDFAYVIFGSVWILIGFALWMWTRHAAKEQRVIDEMPPNQSAAAEPPPRRAVGGRFR
jgi:hypothetical protein